jgi:hypothetical protein
MNTRFTEIYKKELRGGGRLSSMGSAALGRARERLDVRNMLFGGSGFISSTGQKIFGKGYSATGSSATKLATGGDAPAGASMVNEIASSMAKQETLLSVIAKNTMNMNYMARDMNIMRQNIITLTKSVAGKSSKNTDALFFSAKRRDSILSSKASLNSRDTTKSDAPSSSSSGKTSYLGSLVSGVMGVMGGVGSGILGALRGVLAISPILGIIGLAGAAYVIKELAKTVDFGAIKDRIVQAIGMDPNSDKSFTQQLAERLDNIFGTTKFSGSLDWINEKFGTQIDSIGHSIAKITDVTTVYIRAAYQTMADSVSNTGKIFGFLFNEFFQSNKGKIFAAIAAGLAIGYGGKSAAGALAALGAVGLAGLFGAATGEPSREELPDLIKEQQKKIQEFQKDRSVSLSSALEQRSKGGLFEQNLTSNQKELLQMHDNLERLKDISSRKNEEFDKLMNPQLANKFSGYVADAKANLPGGEYGGGYSPATRPSSMSPSSTSPTKVTFASLTKEQQDTVLQKQREREGFFPGSLTHDLNNPGAILYSEHAAKYGGVLDTTGRGVNAVKGKFAKFPTLEQGIEAQRALWLSSGYANLPLDQAINRWTTGKVEGTGEIGVENYKKSIFAAIEKIAPSSGPNLVQGSNTMAAMTRDMNVAQAPNVVVNASSAPVVPGKGQSAPVASATNVDALELFFKYAM